MFDMTREDKVNEFRQAGGKKNYDEAPEDTGLICSCIIEETTELLEAIQNFTDEPSEDNRKQVCKEWADAQYVLSQAALFFDIPADPAFNRVHDSNMSKVVGGKIFYREDGKILKPDTYVAPDMSGL
jgi:predicted HAD superfamily Cof-like phosphohydrolase